MNPIKFNNNNQLPKEALTPYKSKQKNNDMKSAEERLTKGMKKFANCTDYDDAVKAINEAVAETRSEMMEFAEWCACSASYYGNHKYNAIDKDKWFDTIDELFQYYLTNIKANENSR